MMTLEPQELLEKSDIFINYSTCLSRIGPSEVRASALIVDKMI